MQSKLSRPGKLRSARQLSNVCDNCNRVRFLARRQEASCNSPTAGGDPKLRKQMRPAVERRCMTKIVFAGATIECDEGANLRRVLLDADVPLYNGVAKAIHCRGMGTCGTCAVEINGPVSEMTKVETWRLGFPPHRSESGLRLACQCKVLGDLQVKKHGGLWGNQIAQ